MTTALTASRNVSATSDTSQGLAGLILVHAHTRLRTAILETDGTTLPDFHATGLAGDAKIKSSGISDALQEAALTL